MTRRGLILRFGVGIATLGHSAFAEDSQLLAAGAWSKSVSDTEGFSLRGRLVLYERRVGPERRDSTVYIELQDASEGASRPLQLYAAMGRNDFRPESKPGLH